MPTLERIQARALHELSGWEKDLADALSAIDADVPRDDVLHAARARFTSMLPSIPDPGALAPQMRVFTMSGAIYVAFYLVLRDRGWDAARVWTVCERATRLHFERMSSFEKKLASGMLGWPMKTLTRWTASRSQTAPLGGWVFELVPKSERFEYGVNYSRCAIRELAIANGAGDFAPYICLADVAGSEIFGWGLERTQTLAQGGERCDFRFVRGGDTRVRVKLPVLSESSPTGHG